MNMTSKHTGSQEPPSSPAPADVLLADGTIAVIRLLGTDDGERLHQLHERVSDENLRLRFFAAGRKTAHKYVEHVLRDRTLALVAEIHGQVVAIATAEPVHPGVAEVAFLVEDDRHGEGIGSLLLEHLAAAARERGIATFEADVLVENHAMFQVFADAGFAATRRTAHDVVNLRLDTRLSTRSRAAADSRDRRAEARSLHPMLYPRSVAVVGVRRDGAGVGCAVLDNIRDGGFTGRLCVIHPKATTVGDVPAHAKLVDVPDPVDLAVIAVPADKVLAAVADAAHAGVPCAVVISSGFQELGQRGATLQRELGALGREHSIRVVGPNCLGVMSNHPDIRLNATFSSCVPLPGGLAVATQSGGVGIVLTNLAQELGLGIGSLVSLGNKVDVSGNDLLAAWTEDPRVTAAALYLESFGNAPRFARLARRFSERKPLLAVVGGRSAGGRRAGASHTAAAATPQVGVAALFAQAGVIGCDDAEDLAETALLVTRERLPRGPRLGIVSNAGGMGVLAADAAAACGLIVPELSQATRALVSEHVLATSGTSNPVDAGAAVAGQDLAAIVEEVIVSGEVDALLVVLVATSLSDPVATLDALAAVRARHPELPLLLVTHGMGHRPQDALDMTAYRSCAAAVTALGRAVKYAAWLADRSAEAEVDAAPGADLDTPLDVVTRRRRTAARLLQDEAGPDGWVGAAEAGDLLADYGLEPIGGIASSPETVTLMAQSLGFPIAIKVADRDVVHRTERGLVRVGLGSAVDVRAAATSFESEMGREGVPVLVQPVVSGLELAIGLVRDPSFGPLVMVGAGGVNTDLLLDRVYMLPPVRGSDVRRALRGLRCWPLLDGFRGSARVDIEALVRLVVAVGRLAGEVPEVAEVDVNPVMVSAAGCALVDVKLRLQENHLPGVDAPRQLRPRGSAMTPAVERVRRKPSR